MSQDVAQEVSEESSSTPGKAEQKRGRQIKWYRSPIDRDLLKKLSQRSDLMGFVQTLTYLGLYGTTAGLSLYAFGRWPIAAVIGLVFLHGTVCAFMINGIHELGHGTVFKTKALNEFFVKILSFLGWHNYIMFNTSHSRHHAYTLHQPDDMEVTLPIRLLMRNLFKEGFINHTWCYWAIRGMWRVANGHIDGEWNQTLFPESEPQKRVPPIRWARFVLIGHSLVIAVSLYFHLWLLPLLITFGPFYGGALQWLCNNTQHIGLQDNVADFRLNCRTFIPNFFIRVLYWHMNFHIEHHMYPTVPCYNLYKLHKVIKADLPPCAHGLIPVWLEITAILREQEKDPKYQYVAPVPRPGEPSPTMAYH